MISTKCDRQTPSQAMSHDMGAECPKVLVMLNRITKCSMFPSGETEVYIKDTQYY